MIIHEKILQELKDHQIDYRLCEHAAEGRSEQIAKIRGNSPEQAMKAIVIMAKYNKWDHAYFLAIVPGNKRIDLDALSAWTGAKKVIFAPIEKAKELTSCEIGAIPPFSFHPDLTIVADPLIKRNKLIVFNAGILTKSIFMRLSDYLSIAQPQFAEIAKE